MAFVYHSCCSDEFKYYSRHVTTLTYVSHLRGYHIT